MPIKNLIAPFFELCKALENNYEPGLCNIPCKDISLEVFSCEEPYADITIKMNNTAIQIDRDLYSFYGEAYLSDLRKNLNIQNSYADRLRKIVQKEVAEWSGLVHSLGNQLDYSIMQFSSITKLESFSAEDILYKIKTIRSKKRIAHTRKNEEESKAVLYKCLALSFEYGRQFLLCIKDGSLQADEKKVLSQKSIECLDDCIQKTRSLSFFC